MDLNELTKLADRYAELHSRKSQLEADAKTFGEEAGKIEQLLLEAMAESGLQNLKLKTGQTVYRQTDVYAGVADGFTKDGLTELLANQDQFRDLVKPALNMMSLRARIREIEDAGDTLPEVIQQQVKMNEVHRVKVRK